MDDNNNGKKTPILGKARQTKKKGLFGVKEVARPGKEYRVLCPVCGKDIKVLSDVEQTFRVGHEMCNAPIIVKCAEEKEIETAEDTLVLPQQKTKQKAMAEVTGKFKQPSTITSAKIEWGSILARKKYLLKEGSFYIGRKDSDAPSHISVNDRFASARSVKLDIRKVERGFIYHITVIRATNPVLLNGRELHEKEGCDLNYGDIITIGNTKLTFKKL